MRCSSWSRPLTIKFELSAIQTFTRRLVALNLGL